MLAVNPIMAKMITNQSNFCRMNDLSSLLKRISIKLRQGFGENTAEELLGLKFIKDKLGTCIGIVLGDGSHIHTYQHDFIARNLDELRAKGVKKIYLEFIENTNYWALNKFYETGDISDLARIIGNSVDHPESVLALITKCKEKGIRVHELNLKKGTMIERNNYWADQVRRTNPDNEKFILVGGSGHLSRKMGSNGIDKILPGEIATLETVVPWRYLDGNVPAKYTTCSDNYSILTYKS